MHSIRLFLYVADFRLSVFQEYVFKLLDYSEPLWKLDAALQQEIKLYTVRHNKFSIPNIFKQFSPSVLDSRFVRTWNQCILGMSQNEAGVWTKPFWFVATGKTSPATSDDDSYSQHAAILGKFEKHMNRLKPRFILCLGDMTKTKELKDFQTQADAFRSMVFPVDDSIPIVSARNESRIAFNYTPDSYGCDCMSHIQPIDMQIEQNTIIQVPVMI